MHYISSCLMYSLQITLWVLLIPHPHSLCHQAKADKLWTAVARREVLEAVLHSWLSLGKGEATLEVLLITLSAPDFKERLILK